MKNTSEGLEAEIKNSVKELIAVTGTPRNLLELEFHFEKLFQDFFKKLIEKYPNLSRTEIKVISLIRMNYSTREIAEISGRSVSTIENTRNSIRKKMHLLKDDSLVCKILSI